jgi:pyrroloquinoline quinone biosynthesis protein B
MDLFKEESNSEKSKINFIHLNHTNPLLDTSSAAFKKVKESGFNTAEYKDIINL